MECAPGAIQITYWFGQSFCVSQTGTVVAAAIAALASLTISIWRLSFDRAERKARHKFEREQTTARADFESKERGHRQEFEAGQTRQRAQDARELATDNDERQAQMVRDRAAFEKEQQDRREAFEAEQAELRAAEAERLARANDERQGNMQRDLQEFLTQEKWMDARHKEWLELNNQTGAALEAVMPGVKKLLDLGPAYPNLTMTRETAIVLGLFGTFQDHAFHPRLPKRIGESAEAIADDLANLFLTLSPEQRIRQDPKRQETLDKLYVEVRQKVEAFHDLCRRFERFPREFE